MITYLKRNQLNEEKYNVCIKESIQTRVYAFSWYLDCVAAHWDVLVLNDYEAVMPIPWNKKLGIKYSSQPFFTQQLGVFSLEIVSEKLTLEFIAAIPKQFLKIDLQFNSQNIFAHKNLQVKDNYILPLNRSYETLHKEFSKGRKHAVKQALSYSLSPKMISIKELIELSKEHYKFDDFKEKEYQKLVDVVQVLENKNFVSVIGIEKENQLIGGAIFVISPTRITYLFSALHPKGKELQVASFLINFMLQKYENSNKVFDFEGSMIPSIAKFFRSFGAINEPYFLLKKRVL